MNWSNEWGDAERNDAVQFSYDDGQIEIKLKSGDFIGTLVGDLVVYDDWGWHVAHYPTQTRFDDPKNGAVPKGIWSRERLLRWCDIVQRDHGQLWAILRELTPDTFDANDSRTIKVKDQLREWCLSVSVHE